MQIDDQARRQRDLSGKLIFQREADGKVPACIIAIDAAGSRPLIQVHMDQAESDKWNQIDTIVQTKVISCRPGKRNLKKVSRRREQHHRSHGKIPIEVVVQVKAEGKHGIVHGPGGKSETAAEPPTVIGKSRPAYDHRTGEDRSDNRRSNE